MTLKELIDRAGGVKYQTFEEGVGAIEVILGYDAFTQYMLQKDFMCTYSNEKMVLRKIEEHEVH